MAISMICTDCTSYYTCCIAGLNTIQDLPPTYISYDMVLCKNVLAPGLRSSSDAHKFQVSQ